MYLKTYFKRETFKTNIDIQKFSILELKVFEDEYAVIKNNRSEFLSLSKCSLADTVKLRYTFPDEIFLAPQSAIKVEANLGLNNSSPDKLQIICEYGELEPEFVIEDVFSYDRVTTDGIAVKLE